MSTAGWIRRPLPEETGMDSLGSPAEDMSCKFPCVQKQARCSQVWVLPGTVTVETSEAVPPRWNVREGGWSALRPGREVAVVGKRYVGTFMKSGVAVCP